MGNIPDPRAQSYLPPDRALMALEYEQGKERGESCGISQLDRIFTMKRGFLNAFCGWSNAGKTQLLMFIALMRSIKFGTKWALFSPEMINSVKDGDKVYRTGNEIYSDLCHSYTGKSEYKTDRNRIPFDEYMQTMEFIEQHFYAMNNDKKMYTNVADNFMYYHEYFGCDGFIVDGFKDLELDEKGTTDRVYRRAFSTYKEVALKTHGFMYLVGHPKATNEMKERPKSNSKNENPPYKVVTPNMLIGGSAWDNDMDQIISVYRQNAHIDPNDPWVTLLNLKQRKQRQTNRKGEYADIEFDFEGNQFYFGGVCPINGKVRNPSPMQTELDIKKTWNAKSGYKETKVKKPTTTTSGFAPTVKSDDVPF